VRANATMPVVAHGAAVVHIYVDRAADIDMALSVVDNAKTRRYSICNAVDTLLVHAEIAPDFLPKLGALWAGRVEIVGDATSLELLRGIPGLESRPALPGEWDEERLALRAGIIVVPSMDEALAHIEEHSSNHSEAILTQDY